MQKKYLIVIAGPTAVGKTALTIKLAKVFKASILSADSRQFYKEMNIGTAKPTEEELAEAPHYFINSLSVTDEYSVGKFEIDALGLLENLFLKTNVVFMTGGSGLFIKAVTEGLDEFPEIDPAIRKELNTLFETKGLEVLLEELKEKDVVSFETVDKGNYRRVIRALEVIRQTGIPFSSFCRGLKKERNFKIIKIAIAGDREELYERINRRVDRMFDKGLLEEVKKLIPFKTKTPLKAVGYTELLDFLEDKLSMEEARELIKRNSRRYAKRQLTWLRKDRTYTWFHPSDYKDILEFINYCIDREKL